MANKVKQRKKDSETNQNEVISGSVNENKINDEMRESIDVSDCTTKSDCSKVENKVELSKNSKKNEHKNGLDTSVIKVKQWEDSSSSKESSMNKGMDCESAFFNIDIKPPAVNISIDIIAATMFVLAMCTRMWLLEEPRSIVFDELHYGKFASMYMKQTFFFDSHPPLGKQLVALAGYISGFDGSTQFDRIGGEYSPSVPLRALRSVPAIFGCLLIPTVYYFIIELGFTHRTAMLAGLLVVLENSYLTQSRFILMESILIWFSIFGILAYLKFRKIARSFSIEWWTWLCLSSISLTCAIW